MRFPMAVSCHRETANTSPARKIVPCVRKPNLSGRGYRLIFQKSVSHTFFEPNANLVRQTLCKLLTAMLPVLVRHMLPHLWRPHKLSGYRTTVCCFSLGSKQSFSLTFFMLTLWQLVSKVENLRSALNKMPVCGDYHSNEQIFASFAL